MTANRATNLYHRFLLIGKMLVTHFCFQLIGLDPYLSGLKSSLPVGIIGSFPTREWRNPETTATALTAATTVNLRARTGSGSRTQRMR